MADLQVLSAQQARAKGVRLLLAAQDRCESARLYWGWDCRVTRGRQGYIAALERLLDQLSSDDPAAVFRACESITVMGDDLIIYE